MAWAVPAIGAAASLLGASKQSRASMLPYKMAKQHYRQGKQRISPGAYLQAGSMFAPGLFQGGQSPVGGALVQQMLSMLQNPGQLGPQHQERIAEAQNRMMGMMRAAIPGAAMQAGVAPDLNTAAGGVGVPGAMLTSGLLNAQNQANQAYRQLADLQEGLRRQDIGLAGNLFQNMIQQLIAKQLGEAQTLIGAPIPGAPQTGGGAAGGLGNFIGGLLGGSVGKKLFG